jgi:hypothetical protein
MAAHESAAAPGHVVLLGGSIFDNGVYVAGGPDVVTHLRPSCPPAGRRPWRSSVVA